LGLSLLWGIRLSFLHTQVVLQIDS